MHRDIELNRIDEMIIVIEKNRDTSVDQKLLQKPCKSTGYKEWIPEEISFKLLEFRISILIRNKINCNNYYCYFRTLFFSGEVCYHIWTLLIAVN